MPSADTAFACDDNGECRTCCVELHLCHGCSRRGGSSRRVLPEIQAEPTVKDNSKGSYGQILKSSALVGGSQALNLGIGIVRTKAMALLLGPAGFGLFGLYGSIADLTQNFAGLGSQ